MKIIFLDIDGVLISPGDTDVIFDTASLRKLKILKKIIRKTRAKVVIISSRRYHVLPRIDIKHAFKNKVLFISEGYTKLSRHGDIIEYIKDKDVDGFVIIDDNEYDYRSDAFTSRRFVECEFDKGLNEGLIKEVIDKINIRI